MGSAGYVFNPCIIAENQAPLIDVYKFSYKSKYGKRLSYNLCGFQVYIHVLHSVMDCKIRVIRALTNKGFFYDVLCRR